jgi:precorrin-6A/cobalt-precorrin-6A reductase
MTRILILGGTTEASQLAAACAKARLDAVFSYAGRTDAPKAQPLPTRVGGFGGVEGLLNYLKAQRISRVIDATHPFAAQMSLNAVAACEVARVPLLVFERAPWIAQTGDRWTHVSDTVAAVTALPEAPARVFLAIGKQRLAAFAAKPQHHYLLRLVDPPEGPLPLPHAKAVIDTGPFTVDGDIALLRDHAISHIVAKNAGGVGAEAKLIAARHLGLPVILIDRPELPPRRVAGSLAEVMAWLDHASTERGV